MENLVAIILAVVIVIIVLVLAILIYNQMLLINEVNKRLILMTKESQENERITMDEFNDRLAGIEEDGLNKAALRSQRSGGVPLEDDNDEEDAPFNPHTYDQNEN